MKCLGKSAGYLTERIKWVKILKYRIDASYCHGNEYLAIKTAVPIPTDMPVCFKLELE